VRRFLFVLLFLLGCSAQALAAGYDDFARGTTANNQHDSDTAIAAFTAALSGGDLSPNLQPVAHYGRAIAYMRKEKCELAQADAEAALQAKPDYLNALLLRAEANICLGKLDASISDYSAALAQRNVADAHYGRAIALWLSGRFKDAAADFSDTVKLAPGYAYGPIWLTIALSRADPANAGTAKDALDRLDVDDWPAPIVALYRGRAQAADVQTAASQGEAWAISDRRCEADFFVGEWMLLKGDATGAKPLLDSAASRCRSRTEHAMAIFERDRIH
jgi:lipoprotein NlpI